MTTAKLITFTALIYLGGCAGMQPSPQANFAPASVPAAKTAAAPASVSADQYTWDVTPGPAPQTLLLTQKIQTASADGGAAQTPPTDDQVKKAAEQALPAGCKIEEIKTSNGESQVKFSC